MDEPRLVYTLRPGFDGVAEGVRYRTNSLGLRGPEVGPRRVGVRRVALLGDSYAYGLGVSEDATVSAQLERLLDTPSSPTEVLNLGVPAYQTEQATAWLEHRGLDLTPDVVVLLFFGNDHSEPAYRVDPATGLPYTDELPLPLAWKRRLWPSALYALAARASADRHAASGAFTAGAGVTWATVRARLDALADRCAAEGLPLVVANLPTIRRGAVTRDADAYAPDLADAARVSAWGAERGVPVVALGPLLVELAEAERLDEHLLDPTPGPWFDDHLTTAGNGLLAERIAPAIPTR